MAIQPFKKEQFQPAEKKLASHNWVRRFMEKILTRLEFTGDGIDFSETAKGGVHMRVTATGGDSDHPFKVAVSGTSVRVTTGLVYTNDFEEPGNPVVYHIPTMSGTPLDQGPTLTISTGFTGDIVLRMKFSRGDGSAITPWIITAEREPRAIALVRAAGSEVGTDSEMDLTLARLSGGVLTAQAIKGSIYASTSWNTIVLGGV